MLPPLCHAIRGHMSPEGVVGRHPACVRFLAHAGGDANLVLKGHPYLNGHTPLTLALGSWWAECPEAQKDKRVDIIEALMDAGADVDATLRVQNEKRNTALHFASALHSAAETK